MAFGEILSAGRGGKSLAAAHVANHSAGFDSSCPLTEPSGHIIKLIPKNKVKARKSCIPKGPWVIRPFNFQSKLNIENRCQFLIFLSFFISRNQ